MNAKCIDVSVWQGNIDWNAVRKSGIQYAMIRSSYGVENPNQVDAKFVRNITNAVAAGVKCGVYHYSYAKSVEEAKKEAEFCLKTIRGYQIDLPVAFDLEDNSQISLGRTTLTNMVIAFCDAIKAAGYTPMLYTNPSWLNSYLNSNILIGKYDLWLAQWRVSQPSVKCAMWQYSESGRVPGISGAVDMDILYKDYAAVDGGTSSNIPLQQKIIDTARSYIGTDDGYDGGNNNIIFNTDYYGKEVSGDAYPWCCAFVWDIFRMCGASELFYDGKKTAYCPTVLEWGRSNGLTVGKSNGQYGDIVLFDWNGDGVADHIGLIIGKNSDGSYQTVEGNTSNSNYSNGGYVLEMTRYPRSIIGIIRPRYQEVISMPSKPNTTSKPLDILYQVNTDKSGWLPVVKNLEDYAGIDNQAIKGIRVYLKGDTLAVETHQLSNGNIDKITIYAGKHKVRYRVRLIGSSKYLDWMENKTDTGGSSDTFAGIAGKSIDRIQMYIK